MCLGYHFKLITCYSTLISFFHQCNTILITQGYGQQQLTNEEKAGGVALINDHYTMSYNHLYVVMVCDCQSELVCTCQWFEKYHFENSTWKNQPNPWYCPCLLTKLILSFLLAFVQQIDSSWFLPVFANFFKECIIYWADICMGVGGKDMEVGWMVAIANVS